jgi:hypothetical protein
VFAEAVANLREYPRESFFGLGPEARREDFARFSLRTREFAALAGVRLAPALRAGGNVALFSPQTASSQVDYVRSGAFVEVDYREPLNARRGGWYRLDFSQFDDRNGDTWSFRRTDLDIRQYFGFFADRRVFALRGFVSTSEPADDSSGVPFYLMPTLGGNDSLRGFRNYRFRGPHALLLQAEYRWELWSGLDAALFYDAGKVALQRSDLDLKRLEENYGFGFRFNTAEGVTASTSTLSSGVCFETNRCRPARAVPVRGSRRRDAAAIFSGRSALDGRRSGTGRVEGGRAGRFQRLRLHRQHVLQSW